MRLGTSTTDSPRHADTYSDSMEGGRKYNWLVRWQAKEEATVIGSFPANQTDQKWPMS